MSKKQLQKYVLEIPEDSCGEAIGKLISCGAWIDSSENMEGTFWIRFRISNEDLDGYRHWISTEKKLPCEIYQQS